MGFFSNNCRFEACGLKCSSLLELVEHIEQVHVPPSEFDHVLHGISPSSILRLCAFPYSVGAISQTSTSSLISSASDYEDAASDSGQGSIDSASMYKSDSSNLTSPISMNGIKLIDTLDKNNNPIVLINKPSLPCPPSMQAPVMCGFEGCTKTYKNLLNLSQHRQNSHNIITEMTDRHPCMRCQRSYKTPKGLKSHQRNNPDCHLSPVVRNTILKPADQNSGIKKLKNTLMPKSLHPFQPTKKMIFEDASKISELQARLLTPVIAKST